MKNKTKEGQCTSRNKKEEAVYSCRAALVMHRTIGTHSNGTLPPKMDPPGGTKMRPTFRQAQIVFLDNVGNRCTMYEFTLWSHA